MRNFVGITLVALAMSFGFSNLSLAVCVEGPADTFTCNTDPPNPDTNGVQQDGNLNDVTVNVLPGAGIDTISANGGSGGGAIQTGSSNDVITITDADVKAQDQGISTGGDEDTVTIDNSIIEALDSNCIGGGSDNDTITVTNSTITCFDSGAIVGGNGNDTITFTGSDITAEETAINGGNGEDTITVTDSRLTAVINDGITVGNNDDQVTLSETVIVVGDPEDNAISLGFGNDTLTLGSGVQLNNLISCGPNFDTIIFAMDVPEDLLNALTAEILLANPAGDSIKINGVTYEWIDCELLIAELNGVPIETRPIPTLSEWGMIAMAGVIGVAGVLFAVRRRATA